MGLFTNKYKKLVIALEQEKAKNNFSSFTKCDQPLLQGIMVLTYLLHRIAPTEEDANYAFMDKATDNLHNGEYAVIEDVVYTDPIKHMRMTREDIAEHLTTVILLPTLNAIWTLKETVKEKPMSERQKKDAEILARSHAWSHAREDDMRHLEGGGIFSGILPESYKDVIKILIKNPEASDLNVRSVDDGDLNPKPEVQGGGGKAPIVLTTGEDRDAAKPFAAVFYLFHMCCHDGMGDNADAFYASMDPVYKAFSEQYRIVVDLKGFDVHIAPGDARFMEKDLMRDHWKFTKTFIQDVAMKWLSPSETHDAPPPPDATTTLPGATPPAPL